MYCKSRVPLLVPDPAGICWQLCNDLHFNKFGLAGSLTDFPFEDETHDSGDSKGREDVMVRSSRRVHRLQKRERALEKAEKVAAIIASNSAHFRPKKIQGAQELSDPICSYLRDIGRTKLLTAAEEVELSRGIQVIGICQHFFHFSMLSHLGQSLGSTCCGRVICAFCSQRN